MSNQSLTIIITNYRTPDKLEKCIRSILDYNLDRFFSFWEIIVTDSATIKQEKEKIIQEFPSIIFLESQENIGYGRCVNRALKVTNGDDILIINSDIFINPGSNFEEMVDFLNINKDIGVVGPRLINVDGSYQYSAFRFYTPMVILARRTFLGKTKWGQKIKDNFVMKREVDEAIKTGRPIEPDWLMGSALLFKKEIIGKVGFFDERFFMYFEDTDWCRRIKQAGYKIVYFPKCQMIHYHIQASRKVGGIMEVLTNKYTRIHILSWLKYCWKWIPLRGKFDFKIK
ncbi:MAG TPA: glycosyltransferase family 2 protein [Candidatus Portnoybacteria bacterium]|nr:glycosyltransferase family 2 protein [Candidatus Portnoybacteria bacterium]